MSYTAKEQEFIQYVQNRCKEHGVKCQLRNSSYVKLTPSARCSGWFDESKPELVVAMKNREWIGVLAHEYSHLTQWVERIPIWIEAEQSLSHVWEWLDGKDKSKHDMDYHISVARDVELDNEKRTVNIIKRFELDVDIDHYIKKANSYVMFYNWIKQSGRWSRPGNSPYTNPRLVEAMSNKFNMDYSKLSKKIEKIFREEDI